MVFEKYYSILISWNNEILKSLIIATKFAKCDRLSLHCPGDIVTLYVKTFSMNFLGGWYVSFHPVRSQFVPLA
jgi:hypothetical protein